MFVRGPTVGIAPSRCRGATRMLTRDRCRAIRAQSALRTSSSMRAIEAGHVVEVGETWNCTPEGIARARLPESSGPSGPP
jgi:hypothetical protein